MPVPPDLKKRVNSKIEHCLRVAEKHFDRAFNFPVIEYNIMTHSAGSANSSLWRIRLNPVLLVENPDEMIDDTVVHELAHLITDATTHIPEYTGWSRPKRTPHHGRSWKNTMRMFGVEPTRCHTMDVSSLPAKRKKSVHEYRCTACDKIVRMGPVRHKNMLMSPTAYFHKNCKRAPLKYVGVQPGTGPKKKPVASLKKTKKHSTKIDWAISLMQSHPKYSRTEMIDMFMKKLNMSKAGASTYYYTAKRKLK